MKIEDRINLGIVGLGFVGGAVDYGFPDESANKTKIDPRLGTSIEDLKGKEIDATFICVPTPMGADASIDASILIEAVNKAVEYTDGLVVIKSTVIPSIVDEIVNLNPRVIYNPEFLTEKNANHDFVHPPMHVFGGVRESTDWLFSIYDTFSICNNSCPVFHVTPAEASFIKYGINNYLLSKVLWFNQFHDVIHRYGGADYNTIIDAMKADRRIGASHMQVPGHDGRRGFGSACFAKDGPAFVKFSRGQHTPFTVLEEILRRNQDYRNEYGEPLPRELEQHVRFDFDF